LDVTFISITEWGI